MTTRTADPEAILAGAGHDVLVALATLVDRHPDLRPAPAELGQLLDDLTALVRRARGRVRSATRAAAPATPATVAPAVAPRPTTPPIAPVVPAPNPAPVVPTVAPPPVTPAPMVAPPVPAVPAAPTPARVAPPTAAARLPGAPTPPPAPRGRARRWRWLVIVAVITVAVVAVWGLRGATPPVTPATPATTPAPTTTVSIGRPADPPTADGARAAAQTYADAWWAGDATTWWAGLTPEIQTRYTLDDVEQLLDEHPARPRLVATGARLTGPGTALATFAGGDQVLIYDGRHWRWQPSP